MSKSGAMHVAIVIPAHNEAATIGDVVRRASCYAQLIAVVDDGSTDDTAQRVSASGVVLLRNETNQGKAASLWRGMRWALKVGAEAVITLDGDGQHRPEEIPPLLAAAACCPDRIIIGARLRGRDGTPWLRRFANRFADFWISWAAGHRIVDSQSGYRLYPAALLGRIRVPHDRARSFVFESEILIEAARLGFPSAAIEIDSLYPAAARASHYRAWRDTVRITRMVAWQLIRRGMHPVGLWRVLRTSGTKIDIPSARATRAR
jgi:glycosyltransferase involved in cell wall biosynthesis